MPERIEKLKAALGELHRELDQAEGLAEEERDLLEAAVRDLQERLDRTSPTSEDLDSVVQQLEQLEGRFEIRHPTLAGILLRLVDMLGQLGI